MRQRSFWGRIFALTGVGMIVALFLSMLDFNQLDGRSPMREHDQIIVLHGRMMGYAEHSEFHHSFNIVPILLIFIVILTVIFLLYSRYKYLRKESGDVISFMKSAARPGYSNAVFGMNGRKKYSGRNEATEKPTFFSGTLKKTTFHSIFNEKSSF